MKIDNHQLVELSKALNDIDLCLSILQFNGKLDGELGKLPVALTGDEAREIYPLKDNVETILTDVLLKKLAWHAALLSMGLMGITVGLLENGGFSFSSTEAEQLRKEIEQFAHKIAREK